MAFPSGLASPLVGLGLTIVSTLGPTLGFDVPYSIRVTGTALGVLLIILPLFVVVYKRWRSACLVALTLAGGAGFVAFLSLFSSAQNGLYLVLAVTSAVGFGCGLFLLVRDPNAQNSKDDPERTAHSWIKLHDEILAEVGTWDSGPEWPDNFRELSPGGKKLIARAQTEETIEISERERNRFNRMFSARLEKAHSEMRARGIQFENGPGRSSWIVNRLHLEMLARQLGAEGHRLLEGASKDA